MSDDGLKEYGFKFGTYPKVCPKCPPDNEFLGTKESTLCHTHASLERDKSNIPTNTAQFLP